jgi:peptidylprolyl isomerase
MKKTWAVLLGLLVLGAVVLSGCAAQAVKVGDTVRVNYTLRLEDGTVYGTTAGREPAKFTLGEGQLIPGFEEALLGMRVGDAKTVTIPPEKAYGAHRPELVLTGSRDRLPEGLEPVVGQQLKTTIRGQSAVVTVTDVTETTVTLDANPALAGETLTFDIELVGIGGNAVGSGANQTTLLWVILALGVLAAGGAFFYLNSRRRRKSTRVSPARTSERLLAELARLDDDFADGRIAEDAYRRVRAQKKARLGRLMQRLAAESGHK